MDHFIAYHSVNTMGRPFRPDGRLNFLSRKLGHLKKAVGNRVWVIAGTPSKRGMRYTLECVYRAESIDELSDGEYLLDGRDGKDFKVPVELNELPWFHRLRESQANFSLGFNRVREPAIVAALESLAGEVSSPPRRSKQSTRPQKASKAESPRRGSAQRIGLTKVERRAVEARAMEAAIAYYSRIWPRVEDVSATAPYDLRCLDSRGKNLHVEVKGTTGDWNKVRLTAGEVEHARKAFPHVGLFVLYHVDLAHDSGGHPKASGGMPMIFEPWDIRLDNLKPLTFECTLHKKSTK